MTSRASWTTLGVAILALGVLTDRATAQDPETVVVEAARIMIQPGTVLQGEDARIAIRDGKVVGVGPEIPDELIQRSRRVRFDGATITPGFVVAHHYLDLGDDLAETIDAFTPSLRVADAFDPFDESLERLVHGGVTTIGLAPLSKNTFAGIAAAVTSTGELGEVMATESYLKLALVRDSLDPQRYPTSRMGAADLIRTEFATARDPLGATDTDHVVLREVIEGNRRMAIHANTRGEIVTALALSAEIGAQPILIGAAELDECLDRLRGSGITAILGSLEFDSNLRSLQLPAALAEAGIPFSFTAPDPVALRRTLALAVRHGLPREKALVTVTRTPAVQIGVADRVGTLLVDRDADLCVFDGDPIDLTTRVLAVWCDGEPIDVEENSR
jgi:imidazolonepropionase-like amidohydrolase